MKKIPKLGDALVDKGLISRQQQEKAILAQKDHPTRSIGDIINKLYEIPEGKIENIFVSEILIPVLSNWLYSQFAKKIPIQNLPIKKLIPKIDIVISTYRRQTLSTLTFKLAETHSFEPHDQKKFLSTVYCVIDRITLQTSYNANIEFQKVRIEYDIQSQNVTLDNPTIVMETKIRLNQIFKKNMAQQQTPILT